MKKLLGIVVLGLLIISYSDSFSATKNEKINEIDKMFVSGLLSKEECIKFKKVILGENSEPSCGDAKTKSLTIKNLSSVKEPFTVMYQLKALGIFTEPTHYPEGMIKFFGNACKNFHCRATKATRKMALTFKRTQKYHQRHPGEQLYAMAMFELFYQQQLKKNKRSMCFIKKVVILHTFSGWVGPQPINLFSFQTKIAFGKLIKRTLIVKK